MLKIGQNVLKIWKSTSFLPKFSQCTSILTPPPPASLIVNFIYLCEESHYFAFKPPMGGGDVGSIRGFMLFDHYQNLAFMFVA